MIASSYGPPSSHTRPPPPGPVAAGSRSAFEDASDDEMSPRVESPEPQFVSAVLPSEQEQLAWAMRESTNLAAAAEEAWESWEDAVPPARGLLRTSTRPALYLLLLLRAST